MKDLVLILKPLNAETGLVDIILSHQNGENINLNDFEIKYVPNIVQGFKSEITEYFTSNSLSSFISTSLLTEEILQKGTSDNKIISVIQNYMDKLDIDKELIIIDPYFFAKKPKNPNYIKIFDQILSKYISTIDDLIIITNSFSTDMTVKNDIFSTLKARKPLINILHKQNDDYHDRYWISGGQEKGLLMGSSLNSLGNKMALIDRINISDVREIVSELKTDGMI